VLHPGWVQHTLPACSGRRQDLRRERFVDLDEVDVVDGHAGAAW
jgi:hypothetical protein